MFRRKEESSTDSTDVSATSANMTGSASEGQPASSQLGQSQPAPYTPAAQPQQPAVRTIADVTRAATSSATAAPGYRPSPVADFNRGVSGAARTGHEAGRPVSHPHSTASDKGAPAGKTNPRILTVGNDILLKGEIATCDRLVIEGRVEAKLSEVHTVEIASSGSFKGAAEIEDAEISGLFEGDLSVRNRLVIYSSGEVRGNITYGEIEIERGGKLTGQIKTVSSSTSGEKSNLLDVLDGKTSRSNKEAAA